MAQQQSSASVPDSDLVAKAVAEGSVVVGRPAAAVAQQPTSSLRIAAIPIESNAEVFYAQELGFFSKAGINADIELIQNGSAIASAVASNAVDVGYASLVVVAVAHRRSIPFVAIAPTVAYTSKAPTAALFVAADSALRSARDLTGKVVAVAGLGTIVEYAARAWIDKNGGDATSAKFIELAYSAMPAALDAGRIDVALLNEPFLTLGKKSGRVLGYPYDAIGREFLTGVWFTTAQWAKDHAAIVGRFAGVIRETATWANKNAAKTTDILAKYAKIDPAVVATMTRSHFAERLTPSLMQPAIDTAAKYGSFSPFPAADLIFTPT
jgi:NitT/TauT family transport system substrate-binding protein